MGENVSDHALLQGQAYRAVRVNDGSSYMHFVFMVENPLETALQAYWPVKIGQGEYYNDGFVANFFDIKSRAFGN